MQTRPTRRRPRPELLLALLLPLAAVAAACGPAAPHGGDDGDATGGAAMTPAPVPDTLRLAAGEAVEGDPSVPSPHRYEVAVPAGHYLRVVARQLGLDVALRLVPPDGAPELLFDSPSGDEGEEAAHAVAEAAGLYRIEVEHEAEPPAAGEAAGGYEIRVADLRPATADDRLRTAAEAALAVAEASRRARHPGDAGAYEAALALAEPLGDRRLLAYVLYRAAAIDEHRGRRREARARFGRSLALSAELGDVEAQAKLHNSIATLDRRAGRFEEALDHQQRAFEFFHHVGEAALAAETLGNIGSSLDLLGRQREALAAYEEALDRWRRLGDPAESAATRLRFGETLLSLGKLDEAADQLTVAARIAAEHGDVESTAVAERGLGVVLSRRSDASAAVPHLDRALSLARRGGYDGLLAVTLGDLATARLQLGEVDAARRALGEALAIARRLGDRGSEAFLLHKLAQCHHAAGEHGESARLHDAAAEVFADLGDPVALAGAQFGLARAHRLAGDLREGLAAMEKALAAAEEVRQAVGGQELQASYLAAKRHYRELHVDLWMALHAGEPDAGHDLSALLADDRGRARSLVALLDAAAGEASTGPPRMVAERQELARRLAQLRQVAQRLSAEPDEQEALAEVRRRERELLLRLDRVGEELRRAARPEEARHGKTRPAEAPPRPLSAALLDELLDDDTLLLVYSLGEERSFLWALWRGGRRAVVLPPGGEIDLLARRVAEGVASLGSSQQAAARAAGELSRHVLGPVAGELRRHRRLAVVADGGLHLVPFAALPDPAAPAEPLVAAHEVAMLPSLSVLDRLRRRARAPHAWRGLAAVIADPVFDAADPRLARAAAAGETVSPGASSEATPPGVQVSPTASSPAAAAVLRGAAEAFGASGFPRLRGTRDEAEALLGLLPPDAQVFRGFDFAADREAVLAGALGGYRIVHLATHGVLDRRTPALSGLVFSLVDETGRPRDGYLRLHEVYGLDLNAEVIVLSACQSGIGRDMEGEGLIGLTRGFLDAGAPRLVVSLWQVGDEGSAELMERFYRSWLVDGEAPAAALAAAQRSMWSDPSWSAPYHWAGFQLVGDWSATAPLAHPDDPVEKKDPGTTNEPKPDDPLPGPGGGGKKPPRR